MSAYDIVFLGSSPNALAAAARLSGAGRRVLVLETREKVGGPVATDERAVINYLPVVRRYRFVRTED